MNTLTTLRNVELGTFGSSKELVEAIEADGMYIGGAAKDVLVKSPFGFSVAYRATKLEIVIRSIADIGYNKRDFPGPNRGADERYRQIYQCAERKGLELCPAEVGPQLRLQYKDQPMGEHLFIGMKFNRTSSGHECAFILNHTKENGLGLDAGLQWDWFRDEQLFVFVQRSR